MRLRIQNLDGIGRHTEVVNDETGELVEGVYRIEFDPITIDSLIMAKIHVIQPKISSYVYMGEEVKRNPILFRRFKI